MTDKEVVNENPSPQEIEEMLKDISDPRMLVMFRTEELIAQVYGLTLEVLDLQEKSLKASELISYCEAITMSGVSTVLDEKGKAVYSNAESRKAETETRLSQNKEHIKNELKYNELKTKISKLNADIMTKNAAISIRKAFLHGG